MGRGYAGSNLMAELSIDYFYLGHEFDDFDDFTNLLQVNLEFAKDTSTYQTDVANIMKQAEKYAKSFVKQNMTWDTGNLHNSIVAEPNGNVWTLHAPARDDRGHLYAGHIEYGFTDKRGQAHGPWPFLRPAVKLAAMDSRGELADTMAQTALYGSVINGTRSVNKTGRTVQKIGFGRSGERFTEAKGRRAFANMSNAYRRYDENGKAHEWGRAKNGFDDYGGRFEIGTTSNQWSTGNFEDWDYGDI